MGEERREQMRPISQQTSDICSPEATSALCEARGSVSTCDRAFARSLPELIFQRQGGPEIKTTAGIGGPFGVTTWVFRIAPNSIFKYKLQNISLQVLRDAR